MLEKQVPIPIVTQNWEDRWDTWEARGFENDRATRRRMFLLLAALIGSGAVLGSLFWF